MTLSPSLSLSNTLLVPSLSNRLMSVSQVTANLNYVVVMYSTICLLQDILTKEIIRRGTKRGDYTTWLTSVWEEQITCTTQLVTRKDIFGYGTIDLGIHLLGI